MCNGMALIFIVLMDFVVQASRGGSSDSVKSLRKANEELQRRCADGKHHVSLLMSCDSLSLWIFPSLVLLILRWIYTQGIPYELQIVGSCFLGNCPGEGPHISCVAFCIGTC